MTAFVAAAAAGTSGRSPLAVRPRGAGLCIGRPAPGGVHVGRPARVRWTAHTGPASVDGGEPLWGVPDGDTGSVAPAWAGPEATDDIGADVWAERVSAGDGGVLDGGGSGAYGPGGGGGGAGGGGGGDGAAADADGAAELAAALAAVGRTLEQLPPEVRAAAPADAAAYLRATRGAVGGFLASVWPAWRRKVLGDPAFPFKLLMEETIGLGLAASGMIAARGPNIMNELDLCACDIAVGGTLNFILTWMLTPSAPMAGAAAAAAAVAASPSALTRTLGGLPANVFSAGSFTVGQRVGAMVYKGGLFSVAGFAGALVGSSTSAALVGLKRRRAAATLAASGGAPIVEEPLPSVWATSAGWAGYMFLCANPRYQLLAGVERVAFSAAPLRLAQFVSAAGRTVNNVAGGSLWVVWARAIGLQKAPGKTVPAPAGGVEVKVKV